MSEDEDVLHFLNSLASPDGPRGEWPPTEAGGTITPEMLARAMAEIQRTTRREREPRPLGWNVYEGDRFTRFIADEDELGHAAARLADEVEVFSFTVAPARCRAVLFAPDESVKEAFRRELIANNIPVHPSQAVWFEPTQGPAPLRCELDPHPAGTWHRDGRTWFR